jgi:hypothetical protein
MFSIRLWAAAHFQSEGDKAGRPAKYILEPIENNCGMQNAETYTFISIRCGTAADKKRRP